MEFKYVVEKNMDFQEADKRFKEAIEEVGLKVVGEVMPSMKIKKMLDIDIPPYKVLFICHPKYIYEMMKMDYNIGTLVPCHGVVYVKDGKTYVGVDLPSKKIQPFNEKIAAYIVEAEEKMKKAVDRV